MAWSWFGGGGAAGITLARQKEWVEFGAELGYEFVLVDEGWYHWGADGVPSCGNPARCQQTDHGETAWTAVGELVDYAASRGMKVWLWKAWRIVVDIPGSSNVGEPQNRIANIAAPRRPNAAPSSESRCRRRSTPQLDRRRSSPAEPHRAPPATASPRPTATAQRTEAKTGARPPSGRDEAAPPSARRSCARPATQTRTIRAERPDPVGMPQCLRQPRHVCREPLFATLVRP